MTFLRWPKSVTTISIWLTAISIYSRQFQFNLTHGNVNLLTATLTAFFASLTTCQLRRPTGTNSDRYEFISVSIHFFWGMRLHGTGLKMNSDRSDFISVADPTRVTFVILSYWNGCCEQIEIGVSKLKLPRTNWNCRWVKLKLPWVKLKLPWHFWATVLLCDAATVNPTVF